MGKKGDIRGLLNALKYNDPEVQRDAMGFLYGFRVRKYQDEYLSRFLNQDKYGFFYDISLRELKELDYILVEAVILGLKSEDTITRQKAFWLVSRIANNENIDLNLWEKMRKNPYECMMERHPELKAISDPNGRGFLIPPDVDQQLKKNYSFFREEIQKSLAVKENSSEDYELKRAAQSALNSIERFKYQI
jgi:hypothetical protein